MLKTRWETIRDDVAGMLADGVPLEDITGKLEKLKNEYQKPLTNEEWFCSLPTEEKAKWLSQRSQILYDCGQRDVFPKTMYEEDWETWLKEKHHE